MSPVPVLPPPEMARQIAAIKALKLPKGAKDRMIAMLLEAADPNRHDVGRLDAGRRDDMQSTEAVVAQRMSGVMKRAIDALSAVDDFDELVREANENAD